MRMTAAAPYAALRRAPREERRPASRNVSLSESALAADGVRVASARDEQRISNAMRDTVRQFPAAVLNIIRNSPPDVYVFGSMVDVPGLGKVGVFALPQIRQNGLPDLSRPPTIFVSIPSRNICATLNPQTGQVEFGPSKGWELPGNNVSFFNQRTGGVIGGTNASASGNFGIMNSSVTDPVMDWAIDKLSQGVTQIARALQTAGIIGDLATGPSGEGVVGAVTVEVFRTLIVRQLNDRNTWYGGVAWRGVELQTFRNGSEGVLNLSGSKIRLWNDAPDLPGGSGLSDRDLALDLPAITARFGDNLRTGEFMQTRDPVARALGRALALAYTANGQSDETAMRFAIQAFRDGGRAQLASRLMTLVDSRRPDSVTDSAFMAFSGMSRADATVAKQTYDLLRARGSTPDDAWRDVMNAYVNGVSGVRNSGLAHGGVAGGRIALDAMLRFQRGR